jgi:hypothetical protein
MPPPRANRLRRLSLQERDSDRPCAITGKSLGADVAAWLRSRAEAATNTSLVAAESVGELENFTEESG